MLCLTPRQSARQFRPPNVSAEQLRTAQTITDIAAMTVHYNVAVRLDARRAQVAHDTGIVLSPWHPGAVSQAPTVRPLPL